MALVPLFVLATLTLLTSNANAQDAESVYYKKPVEDQNGNRISKTPPQVSFTVMLNRDSSKILTESAPRWDGGEDNIQSGTAGIELGNFPSLTAGDSLFFRFTDKEDSRQDVIMDEIDEIPYTNNPFTPVFTLESVNLPETPQNVTFSLTDANERRITWDANQGNSYSVYRRNILDTVHTGQERKLYRRVATDLNSGEYVDPETSSDSIFAYIVYAKNDDGILSAHSAEVKKQFKVEGISHVSSTSHNITISWDSFENPIDETVGYNIYRREEGESFPNKPISYTGTHNTTYTDTRLDADTDYYYMVKARSYDQKEIGASNEVQASTEADSDEYYTYASLNTAIIIYKNTNFRRGGDYQMSDKEVEDIKFLFEKAREYYWRNSKMNLNMEFNYIIVEEYKDFGDASRADATRMTGDHLEEDHGVVNEQYDLVFKVTPATGGYFSYKATNLLGLPGSDRSTGFAQIHWPSRKQRFRGYPADYRDEGIEEGYQNTWLFIHEAQHAIDGIYNRNDHPEVGHGDYPELYGMQEIPSDEPGSPGYPEGYGERFGKRFDFQARMLRDFDSYLDLQSNWADIYEAKDSDQDQFPDGDPRVPFNEETFGSSTGSADTDNDGYSDRQEAIDGIYHYSHSDPNDPDTDGDGLMDGEDPHPRYKVVPTINNAEKADVDVKVDGDLSEWGDNMMIIDSVSYSTGNQSFNPKVYSTYDQDSLYFAIHLPKIATPTIKFDFDADGRWFGAGNTNMEINVSDNSFNQFRSWDARDDVRTYEEEERDKNSGSGMWDSSSEYQAQFQRRVFYPDNINMSIDFSNPPESTIEMAFPRNEEAGLTLEGGDEFGMLLDYGNVDNKSSENATTFDQWSYTYFKLQETSTSVEDPLAEVPEEVNLQQNYPNPFNPETTIRYALPDAGNVELAVYNSLGRKVKTLFKGRKSAGEHTATFNAGNLSSGVYYYRLETDVVSRTKKMMLIK